MKKLSLTAVVLLFLLLVPLSLYASSAELLMKGIEISKGTDFGDVRYGTRFTGEILNEGLDQIGFWYVTLDYRGAEFVEVCGGENDIIRTRMTLVLNGRDGRSGMVVLFMHDNQGIPDVFWSYSALQCGLGGLDCPYPWETPEESCMFENDPSEYGAVARIGQESDPIFLHRVFATGFFRRFEGADFSGWLRHNYPLVPRVEGLLVFH